MQSISWRWKCHFVKQRCSISCSKHKLKLQCNGFLKEVLKENAKGCMESMKVWKMFFYECVFWKKASNILFFTSSYKTFCINFFLGLVVFVSSHSTGMLKNRGLKTSTKFNKKKEFSSPPMVRYCYSTIFDGFPWICRFVTCTL